jgi:hypothetical protein
MWEQVKDKMRQKKERRKKETVGKERHKQGDLRRELVSWPSPAGG